MHGSSLVRLEIDRYQGHFGIYHDTIQQAVDSIRAAQGDARRHKFFGLGHDGQQRALKIAATPGVGAEQVIEMLFTTLQLKQARRIPKVSLYVDEFSIYHDGQVPHGGLRKWFVDELGQLCGLPRLKHLTLLWQGEDFDRIGKKLHEQVWEVLKRAGRFDLVLEVKERPPITGESITGTG